MADRLNMISDLQSESGHTIDHYFNELRSEMTIERTVSTGEHIEERVDRIEALMEVICVKLLRAGG